MCVFVVEGVPISTLANHGNLHMRISRQLYIIATYTEDDAIEQSCDTEKIDVSMQFIKGVL